MARGSGNKKKGEAHNRSKLTEEEVREIRAIGKGHRKLAEKYGVSETTIGYIINRKIWTHVP